MKLNSCLLIVLSAPMAVAEILLPDPSVFHEGETYYLVGTESPVAGRPHDGLAFPLYESKDLISWQLAETAAGGGCMMRKTDLFATKFLWAPQLFKRGGSYYFAYTADYHWGIARAESPRGPFSHHVEFPKKLHQAIDPFVFQDDDGRVYAYSSCANVGGIACVELSSDLMRFIGQPVRCITNDQPWEHLPLDARYVELNRRFGFGEWSRFRASAGVTEGPTVIKRHGKYVLFYSANDFRSPDYCVGAAVADAPKGPWRKLQTGPVLWREQTGLNGTGHGDVFTGPDGGLWYVFHAHHSGIRISPRRTGVIRLNETVGPDGYPRYEADMMTMRLL